jgi:quercetin dioxygenase-like cupin family protein
LPVSSIPARYRSASQSHPDRELFSITEGAIEVFVADQWHALRAGDVLDIRDGVRHAWRKISEAPVRLLIVTTVRFCPEPKPLLLSIGL